MQIFVIVLRVIVFLSAIGVLFIKNKKVKIVTLVICLVAFISSFAVTMNPYFNIKYYDKYGNSFSSVSEVVYYTEDNWQYVYNEEEMTFSCVKAADTGNYKKTYDADYVYIDENGYLFFSDSILDCVNKQDFCWYDYLTDEYYMDAIFARWDSNGNLYHQ
jgi:hypothetical protein